MPPEVTVLLPVYNGAQFLRAAVVSILKQTYRNFELIVIDDGSTDGCLESLNGIVDKRLVVLRHANIGLARTLNRGLRVAQGEFVARMDADDIAHPDRLRRQVHTLRANRQLVVLGTAVRYCDETGHSSGVSLPLIGDSAIRRALMHAGNVISHPTVMFRKSAALAVGGYPEEVGALFEDYVLWLRLLKTGCVDNLPLALLTYRVSESSLSAPFRLDTELLGLAIRAAQQAAEGDYSLVSEVQARVQAFRRASSSARPARNGVPVVFGAAYGMLPNIVLTALSNFRVRGPREPRLISELKP